MSIEAYVNQVLESLAGGLKNGASQTTTPEQKAALWREFVSRYAVRTPNVVDDSREGIYREREDAQL